MYTGLKTHGKRNCAKKRKHRRNSKKAGKSGLESGGAGFLVGISGLAPKPVRFYRTGVQRASSAKPNWFRRGAGSSGTESGGAGFPAGKIRSAPDFPGLGQTAWESGWDSGGAGFPAEQFGAEPGGAGLVAEKSLKWRRKNGYFHLPYLYPFS